MTILIALLRFTTLLIFLFSNYFASLQASTLYPNTSHVNVVRCIQKERRALLKFKEDAVGSSDLAFSSWTGHDCCTWKGVSCRYPTGEVVKLHLVSHWFGDSPVYLSGKISYHLNELTHLRYLNLSNNDFSGMIPPQLGNLSNLHVLDLRRVGDGTFVSDLNWISSLSSLKYLDLSDINLGLAKTHWLQAINAIPSLEELRMGSCDLDTIPLSLSHFNLTSLSVLDLSDNNINSPSLQYLLNLSTNLEVLSLSGCGFTGPIFSLKHLKSLRELDLGSNSISGPFPTFIGNLSKLEYLDLGYNKMNGSIPKSLGKLTELQFLDVMENEWEGTLSQDHFEYLSKLRILGILSTSGGLVLNLSFSWVPPFSLTMMYIVNCDVGPKFPKWLQTQTQLEKILLQNVSISDTIPSWLWKLSPRLEALAVSHNQLRGSIPANIGQMMPSIRYLDLSSNSLNGTIPISLLRLSNLMELRLSDNYLSGKIHDKWAENLEMIDLSNNNLSGELPSTLLSLPNLSDLKLSNNNIIGELPVLSTTSSKYLSFIDLGDNELSGSISKWMRKGFTSLNELRLRGNMFNGSISKHYCRLQSLRVLDLAQNNLSGPIPTCLSRLTAMNSIDGGDSPETFSMELNLKGNKYSYDIILFLVRAIDLSCNHLSGTIPEDITSLKGLRTLNLSNNHLTGKMPSRIGDMLNLETLDLSSNQIYGQIPPSISSMTALSHLNLSHNDLFGPIPSSTQLSTFDETVYEGNSGLCGSPLSTKCGPLVREGRENNLGEDDTNYKDGKLGLYVSVALGFVFGFWSICGALVAKKYWRSTYFAVIDKIIDQIALIFVMNLSRFYKMIARKGTN